jgi:catechol 2,3-dioxygenase-like lactoylglutathione lyase family enzyme
MEENDMAKPSKFAHVVYSTRRFEEMIDWYQRVFEAKVVYQNPAHDLRVDAGTSVVYKFTPEGNLLRSVGRLIPRKISAARRMLPSRRYSLCSTPASMKGAFACNGS